MNTFVTNMVTGKSINTDLPAIIQEMKTRVVSVTARALMVKAIQSLQQDCLDNQSELQWGRENESDLQKDVRAHMWESLGDTDTM